MALAAEGLVEENKLLLATNLSTGYLHVRNLFLVLTYPLTFPKLDAPTLL